MKRHPIKNFGGSRDVGGIQFAAHFGGPYLSVSNLGEHGVVHLSRHARRSLVFNVAARARLNIGVESRGLSLQQRGIVRVAGDAKPRLYAFDRRVASAALIGQKCMRLRQRTRHHSLLPQRACGRVLPPPVDTDGQHDDDRHECGGKDCGSFH